MGKNNGIREKTMVNIGMLDPTYQFYNVNIGILDPTYPFYNVNICILDPTYQLYNVNIGIVDRDGKQNIGKNQMGQGKMRPL